MNDKQDLALEMASGHYLTIQVNHEMIKGMTQEEVLNLVDEHLIEIYEDMNPRVVWDEIWTLSCTLLDFANNC